MPANRPLRVLFMASSPIGVEPVLDFEGEEAVILDAAAGRVEVVVEESGSLPGLAATLVVVRPGLFRRAAPERSRVDRVGGSAVRDGGRGGPAGGRLRRQTSRPRLQGCGPAWCSCPAATRPGRRRPGWWRRWLRRWWMRARRRCWVGRCRSVMCRRAASRRRCTGSWAAGAGIAEAVTAARRALFDGQSALLASAPVVRGPVRTLGPVVTPLGSRAGSKLRTRAASTLFLDPEGRVKVADRGSFVGRRRDLQALLRALRPDDPSRGPADRVLLHGMGGLGKSSLAARLLDRIRTTHAEHAVWVGKVDTLSVEGLTQRLTLADLDVDQEVNDLLGRDSVPLADRLRYVLDGPLADTPCVFVFDDFEDGNLEPDGPAGTGAPPRRWRCCRRSGRRSHGPAAPAGW